VVIQGNLERTLKTKRTGLLVDTGASQFFGTKEFFRGGAGDALARNAELQLGLCRFSLCTEPSWSSALRLKTAARSPPGPPKMEMRPVGTPARL
jgi:hypothetical protein